MQRLVGGSYIPRAGGFLDSLPIDTDRIALRCLAERPRVAYITPTVRPHRGARWSPPTHPCHSQTAGSPSAAAPPRGAAAGTAATRASPCRSSAAAEASGAEWLIGAAGPSGGAPVRRPAPSRPEGKGRARHAPGSSRSTGPSTPLPTGG